MRQTEPGVLFTALRAEDGAAAAFLVLSIVVLLGSAVISIDVGSLWTTRRSLVTGTDAAALAAASYLARSPSSACRQDGKEDARRRAAELLTSNDKDAQISAFSIEASDCSSSGTVDVSARLPAPIYFGSIFDVQEAKVSAEASAQWGPITTIEGLRPLALCTNDSSVVQWTTIPRSAYRSLDGIDDPMTPVYDHPGDEIYPGAGVVHRIPEKEDSDCPGGTKGNWAWLDFNGTNRPNGASALRRWITEGFGQPVTLGKAASGDEDCRPDQDGYEECQGRPDKEGKIDSALKTMTCAPSTPTDACMAFPIVIYDRSKKRGGRSEYHPSAFLGVVLRGSSGIGGHQADDDDEQDDKSKGKENGENEDGRGTQRYIDLEFVDLLWEGSIGRISGPVTVRAVQICGVDERRFCDV